MKKNDLTARKIGAKLRYFRIKNDLTLDEVGSRLGMSASALSYYESGKRNPSPDTILQLCKLYNVTSVAAFYGDFAEFANVPGVTPDERKIVAYWRSLTPKQKEAVWTIIHDLANC